MLRRRWWEPKTCPGCRRELVRDDFGASTVTADGKQPLCKVCTQAEKVALAGRKYRSTMQGRVTTIIGGLERRTREAGRVYSIERKEVASLLRKRVCAYCGRHTPKMRKALDHVVPLSRGGDTTPANLVMACRRCNHEKSDRTPEEWTDRWYFKKRKEKHATSG
uniref:Putative homing endonuclease n=1 Tax=viral metagenome TaxID=1070528 RepID=A0A6M3J4B2_9ZZZZ